MAHRHHKQTGVAPAELELREECEVLPRHAAVASHRALRPTRGARGVHERPCVLGGHVYRRLAARSGCDEILVGAVPAGRDGTTEMNVMIFGDNEIGADLVEVLN